MQVNLLWRAFKCIPWCFRLFAGCKCHNRLKSTLSVRRVFSGWSATNRQKFREPAYARVKPQLDISDSLQTSARSVDVYQTFWPGNSAASVLGNWICQVKGSKLKRVQIIKNFHSARLQNFYAISFEIRWIRCLDHPPTLYSNRQIGRRCNLKFKLRNQLESLRAFVASNF